MGIKIVHARVEDEHTESSQMHLWVWLEFGNRPVGLVRLSCISVIGNSADQPIDLLIVFVPMHSCGEFSSKYPSETIIMISPKINGSQWTGDFPT